MDIEQINITQLSNILRQCETDILEGRNKLSLTASLLQKINYALQELEYDHINFADSSSTAKEPLKFLQDLIHRTPKLTVTQKIKRETWRVDLSRFSNLKYLELSRIPMHLVEGIQALRSQLQVLVCERCTDCLEEILGTSDVWEELRTAKLCYNDFVLLSPFTNTPWLQYLDLSYNKIGDKLCLQTLKNLKYLNLSFNSLTSVPMLSEEVCRILKVLLINNNYVQDLAAISVFDNLEVLDVSHNLLAEHSAISPILFLPNLRSINLTDNPISFHPLHRFHTCSFLNKGVIPDEFLLDGRPLSILEQKEIGRRGETFSKCGISIPKDLTCLPSGSLSQPMVRSVSKKKVRDVVIEEGTVNSKPKAPVKVAETDQKHLETKKQVEELRERFGGDHWLHSQSGSFVQDLMGLQSCPGNGSLTSPSLASDLPLSSPKLLPPLEKIPPLTNQFDSSASEDYVTALTTQAIIENIPRYTDTSLSESSDQEQKEPLLTKTETESDDPVKTPADESVSENTVVGSFIDDKTQNGEEEVDEEELEDNEDGQLWLVQRKSQGDELTELFLTLNEKEIREKSTSTGRTITKWSLESVESCEKVASDPPTVRLSFNTIRKAYRERTFVMEHADSQELLKKVRSFLEARSLSAMNQVAYRCMKCSSMFSLEHQPTVLSHLITFEKGNPDEKATTKCPTCGSTLVVEMEEAPLPSTDKPPPPSLRHSPSDCSIGSAASLEQRIESGGGGGTKEGTRRYDSDIEVISNPSQSSIEVLEVQARMQGTMTPNRKRSNEERPTVAVPQLNTVPEVQPNTTAALTESSSSGPFYSHDRIITILRKILLQTISLCELSMAESYELNLVWFAQKTLSRYSSTSFMSLIQSVTSKLTPKNSPTVDSTLDNNSRYSYTDFSKVDHRIQLYLFQNIFKDDNEELSFLLRGHLVMGSGEAIPGLLVVSSHSIYILEVISQEIGDDASDWFQSRTSHRRSELTTVFALPWQLGFGFSVGSVCYLILFDNSSHTSSFFSFLTNLKEQDPNVPTLEEDPMTKPGRLLEQMISGSVSASDGPVDWTVRLLTLSSPATVTKDSEEVVKLTLSPFLISTTELLLLEPNFRWLLPSADLTQLPRIAAKQKLANIVDLTLTGTENFKEMKLHFLNELDLENQEEVWSLGSPSVNTINLVIESIREPWEQLFSVPLQLS